MDSREKLTHTKTHTLEPSLSRLVSSAGVPLMLQPAVPMLTGQLVSTVDELLERHDAAELDRWLAWCIWYLGRHRSAGAATLLVHPEHGTITIPADIELPDELTIALSSVGNLMVRPDLDRRDDGVGEEPPGEAPGA